MTSDWERAFQRGTHKARAVHQLFKTNRPEEIDVDAFAAHYGLKVRVGGLKGADGRLVSDGTRGVVRINEQVVQPGRRRFVVAHELGHHLIHAARGEISLCTDGDLLRYEPNGAEPEANFFASELLMPRGIFGPRCDVGEPSFAVVRTLARTFGTTLTATAIQFVRHCPEACALVWTHRGIVKWFVRSAEFTHWIVPGSRVGPYAIAHQFASGTDSQRGEVPLSAWAEDGHGADVIEETLPIQPLDALLSLLWVRA